VFRRLIVPEWFLVENAPTDSLHLTAYEKE